MKFQSLLWDVLQAFMFNSLEKELTAFRFKCYVVFVGVLMKR